jgi:uncharacterized DUF497 family protein
MLFIKQFIWDEMNVLHIGKHHVKPEEVEELFDSYYYLRRLWPNRYIVLGRSHSGRYLFVALDYTDQQVYVATARDMDDKERKLFKKRW